MKLVGLRQAATSKNPAPERSLVLIQADNGPEAALEAQYQARQRLAEHRLKMAELTEARLAIAERRERRAQRAAAERRAWALRKERQAAEQRARECRVCLNPQGRNWNQADLEYHQAGHPANWTWRQVDDAVEARLARLEDAIASLLSMLCQYSPTATSLRRMPLLKQGHKS